MTAFMVSWGHTLTPVVKSADLFVRWPSGALTFTVCLIGLDAARKCLYFTSLSPEKPWSWRSARAISEVISLGTNIIIWPEDSAHEIRVNVKHVSASWEVAEILLTVSVRVLTQWHKVFLWMIVLTTDGWQRKAEALLIPLWLVTYCTWSKLKDLH